MTLILSGTNGLSDVDGDASTPAVRGTDANSGIFFGADQVGVSTNGVERVEFGNSETVFNDGGADVDFRVEGDTDANLLFVDASADAVSIGGNFLFNSGFGSAAIAYGCRAWVNFNGTGTVAIRASGNVSSISDQGTGQYYVNFSTAMPDDDFATSAFANYVAGSGIGTTVFLDNTPLTTRTALIVTVALNANYAVRDCTDVSVSIFR
jgi:hypothetical protein